MVSAFTLYPFCSDLLCNQTPATQEWHGWIEARHCQLIINTLSANSLHSSPCLHVSLCGVVIVFGEESVGWLQIERCLHAHSPCLGITAAWGSEGSAYNQVSIFSIWYLLSLVTCCLSLRKHSLFLSGTNKHMLNHRHRLSASFYFRTTSALHFLFQMSAGSIWVHVLLYGLCACMSTKRFLLSDSAVIGISSYWASKLLSLALLSSFCTLTYFQTVSRHTSHFWLLTCFREVARCDSGCKGWRER